MDPTRSPLGNVGAVSDNPSEVVLTLDRYLDHDVSLVIYGRGALQLGFERPLPEFAATQDIDGIIRMTQLEDLIDDLPFWDAIERTNLELAPKGLYITHLFQEDQVFLREHWEEEIVPVSRPDTRNLKLFRPATIDLILTKMMRGADEQDMKDVAFLARHDAITLAQLNAAFETARLTDIPELHDAFEKAKPVVLEIVAQSQG